MRTVFFSVRPRFADAILEGRKQVELRRVQPKARPGTPILIYASSPSCCLVGGAVVARVSSKSPTRLWTEVRSEAGVTREVYREYFRGAGVACGIWLQDVWRLVRPVPLANLRDSLPGFEPPQSFRYLEPAAASQLVSRRKKVSGW